MRLPLLVWRQPVRPPQNRPLKPLRRLLCLPKQRLRQSRRQWKQHPQQRAWRKLFAGIAVPLISAF